VIVGTVDTAALMQRLNEIYEVDSQEELARALGVPTRSLQRWVSGKGMSFTTAVDLLGRAGWLSLDENASLSRAKQDRARRAARALADQLEELVELLGG
jgi:plasmid maintenance system antidote protein VapI